MANGPIRQFPHNPKRKTKVLLPIEARIQRAVKSLAECDCPVLIAGEAGVGKRAIARLLHAESRRSRGTFNEIAAADCTLQQIVSALSVPGTLYVYDVADLSVALQDLIVEHCLHDKDFPGDRILFGTRRELFDEVKSRRMREDFFHLISVVTIRVTPLRFRRKELLQVADLLLARYSLQFDRPKPALSQDIARFLLEHNWPQNLNDLDTAMKTVAAIGDQAISLAALKAATPATRLSGQLRSISLKEVARAASIEVERRLISEVLAATRGNRKRAADTLGISYKALLYKLKQTEPSSRSISNGNGQGT